MALITRRAWLLIVATGVACADSLPSTDARDQQAQVATVTLAVDGMT